MKWTLSSNLRNGTAKLCPASSCKPHHGNSMEGHSTHHLYQLYVKTILFRFPYPFRYLSSLFWNTGPQPMEMEYSQLHLSCVDRHFCSMLPDWCTFRQWEQFLSMSILLHLNPSQLFLFQGNWLQLHIHIIQLLVPGMSQSLRHPP